MAFLTGAKYHENHRSYRSFLNDNDLHKNHWNLFLYRVLLFQENTVVLVERIALTRYTTVTDFTDPLAYFNELNKHIKALEPTKPNPSTFLLEGRLLFWLIIKRLFQPLFKLPLELAKVYRDDRRSFKSSLIPIIYI